MDRGMFVCVACMHVCIYVLIILQESAEVEKVK